MNKENVTLTLAIETVSFEYFKICIKNGATPDEARAEMMTERAQKEIIKRLNEILK